MRITVESGPKAGTQAELTGPFVIGREPDCNLVLDADTKVSRRHAAFEPAGDGGFVLRDLGSGNGTFVDGARVDRPVRLLGGERVLIGASTIAVARPGIVVGGPEGPVGAPGMAATILPPGLANGGPPMAPAPGWPGQPSGQYPEAAPPYPGGSAPGAYPGGAGGGYPPGSPGWQGGAPGYRSPNRNLIIGLAVGGVLVIALVVVLIVVLTSGGDDKGPKVGAGTSAGTSAGRQDGAAAGNADFCDQLGGFLAAVEALPEVNDPQAQPETARFLSDNQRAISDLEQAAPGPQRSDIQAVVATLQAARGGNLTQTQLDRGGAAFDDLTSYQESEC